MFYANFWCNICNLWLIHARLHQNNTVTDLPRVAVGHESFSNKKMRRCVENMNDSVKSDPNVLPYYKVTTWSIMYYYVYFTKMCQYLPKIAGTLSSTGNDILRMLTDGHAATQTWKINKVINIVLHIYVKVHNW